jgi:VanZ family protein
VLHPRIYVSDRLNTQWMFAILPRVAGARYARGMVSVTLRRLLFWGAALFAFVMAVLPQPPELPGEPSDKIQHMVAFATLGVLGAWAYARTSLLQLLAGLSLFGALIEIVQAIPSLHRDSDVRDWIADTLACGFVLGIAAWRRRPSVREGGPA